MEREHLQHLETVFSCLQAANLKLRSAKATPTPPRTPNLRERHQATTRKNIKNHRLSSM